MEKFKDLFEYNIYFIGNSLNFSYRILNNKSISIAAYIYRCNKNCPKTIVYKTSYNKSIDNHKVNLVSGRYQVKFFVKNKGDTKYSESFLTSPTYLNVLKNFLPRLYEYDSIQKIIFSISKSGLNEIDFKVIAVEKHRSNDSKHKFFYVLSETALKVLTTENCTYETANFLLNCIFYTGSKEFFILYKHELLGQLFINKFNQSRKDILFWFGVMEHKLGNKEVAYSVFNVLLSYKSELDFHQTGALSYLSSPEIIEDIIFVEFEIKHIDKIVRNCFEGCILISCDFGYFSAYLKNILHTFDKRIIVHLHLILPNDIKELNLSKISEKYENIFISYEYIDKSIGNIKTYFSVSRYLILPEILNRYNLPTIVADADLDFSDVDLLSVFTNVGDNQFALNIKDNDLPWLKVTAGFNVFGKDTGNVEFFKVLIRYIRFCFATGRDGWMLDQTALSQCLYFYSAGLMKSSSDFKINKLHLEKTVRQVSNRAKKRVEAKQALSTLKHI